MSIAKAGHKSRISSKNGFRFNSATRAAATAWNNDGDGYYGEPNDGAGGGDVDMMAEVYVGRCAAGSTTEARPRFSTS